MFLGEKDVTQVWVQGVETAFQRIYLNVLLLLMITWIFSNLFICCFSLEGCSFVFCRLSEKQMPPLFIFVTNIEDVFSAALNHSIRFTPLNCSSLAGASRQNKRMALACMLVVLCPHDAARVTSLMKNTWVRLINWACLAPAAVQNDYKSRPAGSGVGRALPSIWKDFSFDLTQVCGDGGVLAVCATLRQNH